jgi:diadenosine tetraphosphate (Ap4A) HIT family hydrolase
MADQQQLSLPGCPFCAIGTTYPPSRSPSADHDLLSPPAFVVLSTPLCLAFLDIMPLAPGHLLVTTRAHREKISEVGEDESRELGLWLPRLSRVLANVTDVHDWNIVQNNGVLTSAPLRYG